MCIIVTPEPRCNNRSTLKTPKTPGATLAAQLRSDRAAGLKVAADIIRLDPTNFVERPWGGLRMLGYKGCLPLPDQKRITGLGVGEAFETAACDSDEESRSHPSVALLGDGSRIGLPELLALAGPAILGPALYARCGNEIPLLPKTLDIAELLSVQAHPPGNTELYVILDAEPGASIRLGFRHNVEAQALRRELEQGRQRQVELGEMLHQDAALSAFNDVLGPLLARREAAPARIANAMRPWLADPGRLDKAVGLVQALGDIYWHLLDLMNEIKVSPGQVIYNATPERVRRATGAPVAAEVHALGNPERREILMLEIRRPGVTYRAWDNVRFPLREIDIAKTLAALNLGATGAEEFDVTPADAGPGTRCTLVESEAFVAEQLSPAAGHTLEIDEGRFSTLHVVEGEARLQTDQATTVLARGASALVPAALKRLQITSAAGAKLIRVWIP